ANATPATLQKLEVLDAANPEKVLATFGGSDLLSHLRTTGSSPVEDTEMEFNSTRLFLIDLDFSAQDTLPRRLLHRVELLGGAAPSRKPATPAPLTYTAAPLQILMARIVIGPPLLGKGWVAANGCCGVTGVHRSSGLSVNGGIYFAQRFAIDWMQMDKTGKFVHGDSADVNNYTSYGADVIAVADGKVVSTLNSLDDQKPGTLPDPKTINVENVDGNHVVLDLGTGVYAFYAHLQNGSIKVAVGARVKRGQLLGKLGNTGNTSAPHLHFHLMDGPSVLGSQGLPYVIDSFVLAGQVPVAKFEAAAGVEGDWGEGIFPTLSPRKDQFPLDLAIVDFPARAAAHAAIGARKPAEPAAKTP
ncbi:MAG: M23 family metallopeptidase, partial [Candidatus Acidiferrales bacterium]